MKKLDINDPTDLDILKGQFDMVSREEWEEYVELAESLNYNYKNVNILKTAARKAGISKYLSPKVISWVMSLVDQLDAEDDDEYEDEEE
jgi:hypothetical protein